MIQVRGLSKMYGKKHVVEDVTVDIQRGQITSFIGPNGAGKSTLLSMVSRLLDADTGEVLVDKSDARGMKSNEFSKKSVNIEAIELYECSFDDSRACLIWQISIF